MPFSNSFSGSKVINRLSGQRVNECTRDITPADCHSVSGNAPHDHRQVLACLPFFSLLGRQTRQAHLLHDHLIARLVV